MCHVNGKAKNSTPHCSHIFQPIFLKLKTKKDIWDTTLRAKLGWCGTTGRGSAKMANFGLLFVLYFLYSSRRVQITPYDRSWPMRTQNACFCTRKCLLGVSMIKSKVSGQNSPKTWLWFLLFWKCQSLRVAVNKRTNICFVHLYLLFYY